MENVQSPILGENTIALFEKLKQFGATEQQIQLVETPEAEAKHILEQIEYLVQTGVLKPIQVVQLYVTNINWYHIENVLASKNVPYELVLETAQKSPDLIFDLEELVKDFFTVEQMFTVVQTGVSYTGLSYLLTSGYNSAQITKMAEEELPLNAGIQKLIDRGLDKNHVKNILENIATVQTQWSQEKGSFEEKLQHRKNRVNESAPQVGSEAQNAHSVRQPWETLLSDGQYYESETIQTVEVAAIAKTNSPTWGEMDYRSEVIEDIVQALTKAASKQQQAKFLEKYVGTTFVPRMMAWQGPNGPLVYDLNDGTHRTHAAVIAGLKTIPATLTIHDVGRVFKAKNDQELLKYWQRLLDTKRIEGNIVDGVLYLEKEAPAPWLLLPEKVAAQFSQHYLRAYPDADKNLVTVPEKPEQTQRVFLKRLRKRRVENKQAGIMVRDTV